MTKFVKQVTREAIDKTGALSQGRNTLSEKATIIKELVHSVLFQKAELGSVDESYREAHFNCI